MIKNITGERIKILREEKTLTQDELAKSLEVARQTISYYESGKRFPDSEFVIKLCKYFRCSTDFILGVSDFRTAVDEQAYMTTEELLQRKLSNLNAPEKEKLVSAFVCFLDSYCSYAALYEEVEFDISILQSFTNLVENFADMLGSFMAAVSQTREGRSTADFLVSKEDYVIFMVDLINQHQNMLLEVNLSFGEIISGVLNELRIDDKQAFDKSDYDFANNYIRRLLGNKKANDK